MKIYDAIIVGGGPAGLSAALMLGRCRRSVLLCDDGNYRNSHSKAMHGFLSREGMHPAELRVISRQQLLPYETVSIQNVHVSKAVREHELFCVTLDDGIQVRSKKLLLATGICDEWPSLPGAQELYGKSIFHCPFCDAWEVREQPLGVIGADPEKCAELALELTIWSKQLLVCTSGIPEKVRVLLNKHNICIFEQPIAQLESREGILEHIVFNEGQKVKCRAIFFTGKCRQQSTLAVSLGCEFDKDGGVKVGKYEATCVPGCYVIGDSSRDVLHAIVAAAEGFEAGYAINRTLLTSGL